MKRAAIQTIEGEQVVFVRTATGFQARPVTTGAGSDAAVPILTGLKPGEQVVVQQSYLIKADMEKSTAEEE